MRPGQWHFLWSPRQATKNVFSVGWIGSIWKQCLWNLWNCLFKSLNVWIIHCKRVDQLPDETIHCAHPAKLSPYNCARWGCPQYRQHGNHIHQQPWSKSPLRELESHDDWWISTRSWVRSQGDSLGDLPGTVDSEGSTRNLQLICKNWND